MLADLALYGCLGTLALVLGTVFLLELRRRLLPPETAPHTAWLAEHLGLALLDARGQSVDTLPEPRRYGQPRLSISGSLAMHPITIRHVRTSSRLRLHRPSLGPGEVVRVDLTVDNPGDLTLYLAREDALTTLGKALGVQDIEVGLAPFDAYFIVQSNRPGVLRRRLDARLSNLVLEFWKRHRPPRLSHVRLGGDTLLYQEPGTIDSVAARNRIAASAHMLAALTALVSDDERPAADLPPLGSGTPPLTT